MDYPKSTISLWFELNLGYVIMVVSHVDRLIKF